MTIVDHIEIAKLELQRGDILLVRTPSNWTGEQNHRASEGIAAAMRQADINVPLLVGTKDVDFQVVRNRSPIDMTECSDGTFRTEPDRATFEAAR